MIYVATWHIREGKLNIENVVVNSQQLSVKQPNKNFVTFGN